MTFEAIKEFCLAVILLGVFLSSVLWALCNAPKGGYVEVKGPYFSLIVAGTEHQAYKVLAQLEAARLKFETCPETKKLRYPRSIMVTYIQQGSHLHPNGQVLITCGKAIEEAHYMTLNTSELCERHMSTTVAHELLHLAGVHHEVVNYKGRLVELREQKEMRTCWRSGNE